MGAMEAGLQIDVPLQGEEVEGELEEPAVPGDLYGAGDELSAGGAGDLSIFLMMGVVTVGEDEGTGFLVVLLLLVLLEVLPLPLSAAFCCWRHLARRFLNQT